METVNIEKTYGADKITRYYLTHPSADGTTMVLTKEELEHLYLQIHNLITPSKPQLIIHETDCHGCGNIIYGNEVRSYTYDDGCFGDARATIEELIKIGFIDGNRVTVIEGDEIYLHLNIK